jgi:hypothetical protein
VAVTLNGDGRGDETFRVTYGGSTVAVVVDTSAITTTEERTKLATTMKRKQLEIDIFRIIFSASNMSTSKT